MSVYKKLLNKWVFIEWIDAAGPTNTWKYRNELSDEEMCAVCFTTGYLISETKFSLEVAQNVAHQGDRQDEQVTGVMTITKCSITSIVEII